MSTIELQVASSFPPGTKVEIHPRVHDSFTPGQTSPSKTVTVEKDGSLKVSGLVEHGPYFAAAEIELVKPGQGEVKEWRAVAFTASNPGPANSQSDTAEQARREADAAAKVAQSTSLDLATVPGGAPQPKPVHQVVEGARDTSHIRPERIEGVKKGTQLASHTVTGQAVVVTEQIPRQEDVKKGTPQESDTETGQAALVEEVPAQEDISKRTKQESATETGVATPVAETQERPTRPAKPTQKKVGGKGTTETRVGQ